MTICSPEEARAWFFIADDGTLCRRGRPDQPIKGTPKNSIVRFMHRGRSYNLARTTWCCYYGEWPSHQLKHRDGNAWNNAIGNLELNLKCPIDDSPDAQRQRRISAIDALLIVPRTKPLFSTKTYESNNVQE